MPCIYKLGCHSQVKRSNMHSITLLNSYIYFSHPSHTRGTTSTPSETAAEQWWGDSGRWCHHNCRPSFLSRTEQLSLVLQLVALWMVIARHFMHNTVQGAGQDNYIDYCMPTPEVIPSHSEVIPTSTTDLPTEEKKYIFLVNLATRLVLQSTLDWQTGAGNMELSLPH